MVTFLRKRLQVFVSSTYTDLTQERQAAVEAILVAGDIPAGMELFTSGDESQMEVIRQWIDESDVYLLILGGRYGSVDPKSGKSYTHLEYDYAVQRGKPLFSCVVTDASLESKVKSVGTSAIETTEPQKLRGFRAEVLGRMVRFYEDAKDIKIAVGETLSHFTRRDDLIGWVRPSAQADMPALADEIARLSKENAELRTRLTPKAPEERIHGLTFLELRRVLEQKNLLDFFYAQRRNFESDFGALSDGNDAFTDLSLLGLVERIQNMMGTHYRLSNAGRTFLNRLELELHHPLQG